MSRKRGIELTESDQKILRWIGEQYMVSLTLLEVLLRRARKEYNIGDNYRANIYRTMKRWRDCGYVDYGIVDRVTRIWLTTPGMRYAGLSYRGGKHNQSDHTEAIGMVRFYLEERLGDRLERWVDVRSFDQEPLKLKYDPDGLAIVDGTYVPVEVELRFKGWPAMSAKMSWYCQEFEQVWYYTTPSVQRALELNLPDDEVILTRPLREVRDWLESYSQGTTA